MVIERPWGKFEQFTHNEESTVKLIHVNPKKRTSLQSHNNRDENWVVIVGSCDVIIGDQTYHLGEGDSANIMRGDKHRITGGPDGVIILEIAKGDFNEDDIERFEDDYGR